MAINYAQPKTGLGSTAETNRLLGRTGSNAFVETSNSSATSPAKNQYVDSLNAARETAVDSGGSPYGGNLASLSTFSGGSQGSTPAGIGSTTTNPDDPLRSYRSHLSTYGESLNPDQYKDIEQDQAKLDAIKGLQEQQDLSSRKAYEDIIHQSGMLKSGAEQAGSVSNRNNAYVLANLGIAESAASRKLMADQNKLSAKQGYLKTQAELSKPFEMGDSYYDVATGKIVGSKSGSGFSLSGGQSQFDAKGNLIASLPAAPKSLSYLDQIRQAKTIAQQKISGEIEKATPGTRDPDGFLTPEAYRNLKAAWVSDGMSGADFDAIFSGYANPANAKQYGTTYQTKPSGQGLEPEYEAILEYLK